MADKRVAGEAGRAMDSGAFESAARAGYAINGVLHLTVGYLILRIALGSGGTADQSGALATLAGKAGGAPVLWIAAIALVALSLWRLAETVAGTYPTEASGNGRGRSAALKRLTSFGLAVLYLAIAYLAIRFAAGRGESSSQRNAGLSARLMQSGWGKAVLIVIGLAILSAGGYHVYKGLTRRFFADLKVSGDPVLTLVGVTGYVAKGVVLAGAGILVIVATLNSDPAKASGIDGAVKTLGAAAYGKVLLILAAVGMAAFGVYSFARSRYGRM
jgi:hypothetical protein